MRYLILTAALFTLSACNDITFGVGAEAPLGENGTVSVSTNTRGETEVGVKATIGG